MMMNEWNQNVKKRREQQVRAIKQGVVPPLTSPPPVAKEWETPSGKMSETAPWNQVQWKEPAKAKKKERFFLQLMAAGALFTITFLIFHSKSPVVQPVEQFVSKAMTREFNFVGVSEWYKQYVGNSSSILPAFMENSQSSSTNPKNSIWIVPVRGVIVLPYDEKRKGIVIRTSTQAEVVAATEGWVTYAGYKDGLGNTIIIQHANGQETWYGWLQSLDVKEKDWVKSGQPIGRVGQTKGQSLVYIALKKDKKFINPSGVIPLE